MTDQAPRLPGRGFPTTRWTLILASREGTKARQKALEELLSIYWKPVYFYARRKGLDVEAAKDAVQGFFLHLLERGFLERLDPAKGRFRGYLRTALDHYLINAHEKEAAQKRGGGVRFLPLDLAIVEKDLATSPPDPEIAYDREWALGIMERSLGRLRREYEEGRRHGDIETVFKFFQVEQAPSYAEAAQASRMTVPQFKASLHRARARFREILKAEIGDTLDDQDEIEQELAHLARILTA